MKQCPACHFSFNTDDELTNHIVTTDDCMSTIEHHDLSVN